MTNPQPGNRVRVAYDSGGSNVSVVDENHNYVGSTFVDRREAAVQILCDATVRHAHGIAHCDLPEGHGDNHEGHCVRCWEDDDQAHLRWTEQHEEWPI